MELAVLAGWLTLMILVAALAASLASAVFPGLDTWLSGIPELPVILVLIILLRTLLVNHHTNAGFKAMAEGDYIRAGKNYRRLLILSPFDAGIYNSIGQAFAARDRWGQAIKYYRKAIRLRPSYPEAYSRLGLALQETGDTLQAIACQHKAIEKGPGYSEAYTALGLVYAEAGKTGSALAFLDKGYKLKRRAGSGEIPPEKTGRHKLGHDLEQLEYLMSLGLIPEGHRQVTENYRQILSRHQEKDNLFITLQEIELNKIKDSYDKNIYIHPAPAVEKAVNITGADKIRREYAENYYGLAYSDNFLTPAALESLREFCLRSTVWHDYRKSRGYIGSYMDDGFYNPLLFQVAEELKTALPEIFGGLPLTYMWAYKYTPHSKGFKVHADRATVNVNFWLTPDEACLEPENSGMVVYLPEGKVDWDFDRYNIPTSEIQNFIEKNNFRKVNIPYRQNRVVIFNSALFHETAPFKFKEGYENHRINVTMLFGNKVRPPRAEGT